MKDQLFSGRDVTEALAVAGRSLGQSPGALRYVVLDAGAAGALGMAGTPARIAVLLDAGPRSAPGVPEESPAEDVRGPIERLLRDLAEAAGIELVTQSEETTQALSIRLSGPGGAFFLDRDGQVLKATEYLLQRMYGHLVEPRRLRLDCEGHREQRDAALAARATELAAAVQGDGEPRSTGPLNAYERRIVHVAIAAVAGLRSHSIGEGSARRVVITLEARAARNTG